MKKKSILTVIAAIMCIVALFVFKSYGAKANTPESKPMQVVAVTVNTSDSEDTFKERIAASIPHGYRITSITGVIAGTKVRYIMVCQ